MVRIANIEESLDFYCNKLGMIETRRFESEEGRFTLIFLAAPDDTPGASDLSAGNAQAEARAPLLELTYNWPSENGETETYTNGRNFGHLAYEVENIYDTCKTLMDNDVDINRPPRDGRMAFIKSPDGISIELLQAGEALEPAEPWQNMENSGEW